MNWYKKAQEFTEAEKVKLPKGWKVTVKKEKMCDGYTMLYVPHFWFEGQHRGSMPTAFDYASKARELGSKYLLGILSGEL